MVQKSEFRVPDAYSYNHKSAFWWLVSHIARYRLFFFIGLLLFTVTYFTYSQTPVLIGQAAEELRQPSGEDELLRIALTILGLMLASGVASLLGGYSIEFLAQRTEADSREELYISLLGKSQIFHDRQRVGDIMARATDDVRQLNFMINPGLLFVFEMVLGFVVPFIFIASLDVRLLLVPVGFFVTYVVTARRYSRQLNPVVRNQRKQFGIMNAGLEETISGIEVVKASTQEHFERTKFRGNARAFRDYFVKQGQIEAGYLPLLLYGIAVGLALLHGIILYRANIINLGEVIALMGLMNVLRFPTFLSLFSLTLIQNGLASAARILNIITAETDLDENPDGYIGTMRGEIIFENVSFAYEEDEANVLDNLSFRIRPGQTVAIVGQTGSGKSTLTDLVNRTYDPKTGRILIDNVDVREWSMDSLRSQISRIEQDVFLFSRTVAENIAFGAQNMSQQQIEEAAKLAQAHGFILSFNDGYETELGERGVTLSGGQRQRLALARAFLSDPCILILDDSTSAIDSATEDEIQRALHHIQEGRTTLLITHRLSQIRWADYILVLDGGRLVASGTHDELLRRSPQYRRIFARYEVALPPLETATAVEGGG